MRFAILTLLLISGSLQADDGLTPLHPPRPTPTLMPMPVESMAFVRQSYYDRWQFYAVDQQGYFRPRVVLAPTPYYLYNGRPFPLLPVEPRSYIPYITD